jgi:hypothetical protein
MASHTELKVIAITEAFDVSSEGRLGFDMGLNLE